MDAPRDRLLALIDEARDRWRAAVAATPVNARDLPAPGGGWSLREVAIHLDGWRELTVARLAAAAAAADGTFVWPDWPRHEDEANVDDLNPWFFARAASRPTAELLAEAEAQFAAMHVAVAALPPGVAEEADRYPWLGGYTVGDVVRGSCAHLFDDHLADLLALGA